MSHKVTTTLTALGSTNQLTSLDQNQEITIQKIKKQSAMYTKRNTNFMYHAIEYRL